jgi:hypothetical protein
MRRAPVLNATVTAMPEVSGWTTPSTDRLDVGLQHRGEHEVLRALSAAKAGRIRDARVGTPSIALASGSGNASLAMRVTCALIAP